MRFALIPACRLFIRFRASSSFAFRTSSILFPFQGYRSWETFLFGLWKPWHSGIRSGGLISFTAPQRLAWHLLTGTSYSERRNRATPITVPSVPTPRRKRSAEGVVPQVVRRFPVRWPDNGLRSCHRSKTAEVRKHRSAWNHSSPKRVKTGKGMRYCPVVLSPDGRVKPDAVWW